MTAKCKPVRRALPALLTATAALWAQTGTDSAKFHGTVLDQGGAPVEGATVTYTRLVRYAIQAPGPLGQGQFWSGPPQPAPGEFSWSGAVTTGAGGNFEAAVPPGDYSVCVGSPSGRYLDPCLWSQPAGAAVSSLSPGEVRDIPAIVLTAAALISVHVADPSGLLGAELGPLTLDPGMIIGVQRDDGAFYRAWPSAGTASGRDFQIAVPFNVPLRLWVFSRTLSVADSQRRTLSGQGEGIPFEAVQGQDTHIDLSVAGK